MANASFSLINDVTMTSLLFEGCLYVSQRLDFTYYLSIFCLMCTFRERLDFANNSANANDIRLRHSIKQLMSRSWRF